MNKKPTVLITGAVSLLGRYLWKNLKDQYRVVLTSRNSPVDTTFENAEFQHLDVTNKKMVKQTFKKVQPDVVIHLASLSNIDYCENHPEEAWRVNVKGTGNVCEALSTLPRHSGKRSRLTGKRVQNPDFGVVSGQPDPPQNDKSPHLIFISSSMVFRGDTAPYKETAEPNPVNVYGETKTEAEKIVKQSGINSTIIRFSTLFGYPPQGARDNDLTLYLKKLQQTKPLHLVNDRFYNPLSAKTAAEVIKKIIDKRVTGIFHAAGQDRVNRFEFVKVLIKTSNPTNTPELFSVPNNFFKHLAPRPIDITLATEKIENTLGVTLRTLCEELAEVKNTD